MSVYGSDPFSYRLPKAQRLGRGAYGFENWLLGIEPPTRKSLERHRSLFGPDCVYIPKETRSASELRAAGLTIKQIAHTLGIKERQVQVQLRVAEAT